MGHNQTSRYSLTKLLSFIENRLRGLYEIVGSSTGLSSVSLSGFRILFGLYGLLIVTPSFSWVADTPNSFYLPQRLSVFHYLPGVPPMWAMTCLDILLVLSLVGITIGYRTRWSTWLYIFLFLVGWGFRNSFGKIDHGMLIPYVLACLSVTDWGTHNAIRPDRKWGLTRIATSVAAIFLCFGMFTAGFPKALVWLDFKIGTSGFLNWFYSGYYNFGRQDLLMESVLNFPTWLLEVLDYAAVAVETLGFAFLLLGPLSWRFWILCAAGFHLGATLFLNIPFDHHIMMYTMFLCGYIFTGIKLTRSHLQGLTIVALLLGSIHTVLRLTNLPSENFLVPKIYLTRTVFLYVCVVLWSAVVALGCYDLFKTAGLRNEEVQRGD